MKIKALIFLLCWIASNNIFAETFLGQAYISLKSDGRGTMQSDVSSELESYRQSNNGKIVLGVEFIDWEYTNGYCHNCKGAAISEAYVKVTKNGEEYIFRDYSTLTMAMLPGKGDERVPYYTVLGIYDQNIYPHFSRVDATVSINVDMDLSNIDSYEIVVRHGYELTFYTGTPSWLDTFYRYYGHSPSVYYLVDAEEKNEIDNRYRRDRFDGFGVIDLRRVNAEYLVETEQLNWVSSPSADAWNIIGFEDQYPELGDYDFNDLVLAYKINKGYSPSTGVLKDIKGEAMIIARGAAFDSDVHISMPLDGASGVVIESLIPFTEDDVEPEVLDSTYFLNRQRSFNGDLDVRAFQSTKTLMPSPDGCKFANTEPECDFVVSPVYRFHARADTGSSFSGDVFPYLLVHKGSKKHEVHLANATSLGNRVANGFDVSSNLEDGLQTFVDKNLKPFAMIMPENWMPPLENLQIESAYPEFNDFVTGNYDGEPTVDTPAGWYMRPAAGKTVNTKDEQGNHKWKW